MLIAQMSLFLIYREKMIILIMRGVMISRYIVDFDLCS